MLIAAATTAHMAHFFGLSIAQNADESWKEAMTMRLVDADAIYNKAQENHQKGEIEDWEFDSIINYLDGTPTINAAEIVYCKDCKYGDYDSKPDGATETISDAQSMLLFRFDRMIFAVTENGGKNEHTHYKHQGRLAGGRGHLPRHLRQRSSWA